jgi:integrase
MPRAAPNKRKLTALYLQKLKPQVRTYLVWDTMQRGLGLRVEPTGYSAWKLIYRHHGRPRWYHLGAADALGLADARVLAAELMLEVARGKDPQAERKARRGAGTFAELAERYVEEHAKRRNKSWRQAAYLVRRYLLPHWGNLNAKAIARSDVRAVMGRIAAPVVANQVLAAASAMFSWAIKQELIAINPCTGVERNATRSRERVLSDAELPQFWSALDSAGLLHASALRVLLLCGQRPGEVAAMRREHVTRDGWWVLPGAPDLSIGWPGTKNGQSHRVWLPQATQAIIAELSNGEQPTGHVFGRSQRGATNLAEAMRAVCRVLGAERATPHDLRRTHGTMITRLGFGREAMNRIQNHKEGGIADVYDQHRYTEENRRVMEAVAKHMLTLVAGEAAATNVVQFNKT